MVLGAANGWLVFSMVSSFMVPLSFIGGGPQLSLLLLGHNKDSTDGSNIRVVYAFLWLWDCALLARLLTGRDFSPSAKDQATLLIDQLRRPGGITTGTAGGGMCLMVNGDGL